MATDFWIASGAGNWLTTADWSTHSVPGQSDDVVIGSSSSAATVTSTGGVTIDTLNITPNDELSINGEVNGVFTGAFNLINGMPEGNFGTLDLEDAGFHVFGGTINNSGLIFVKANQPGGGSFLFLADNGGGTVTLNGAGMVVLDGNDQTLNAVIQGQEGGRVTSTLINDDNNISGTGTVGADLNIINHGTFETNNFLELGTMQIVGSAGGGSFVNDNLLIADPNGTLILGMAGETSQIINNGLIELKNSVQGTQSTIEIAGTVFLQNNQVLGLGSNIADNWIVGDPAENNPELILDGGTLGGVGRLGGLNLTLFIEAQTYVVCASGTMQLDPVATTIQPEGVLEAIDGGMIFFSGSTGIVNQGTIAALNGGKIDLDGNITNSNGGVVNIGSNSEINLETGFVVSGTIEFTGSNATIVTRSPISTQTTVSGTGPGDSFDFQYLSFFSGEHAVFQQNGSTGTLSVVNSSGVTVTSVTLAGQYTSADFTVTGDSHGLLLVEFNPAAPTPPTPLTAVTTSVQQEIFGLYAALYGRAAEFPGYSFWIGTVAQQSDGAGVTVANANSTAVSLTDEQVLGQAFVNTQATFFNQTYANLNDSQFINALYVNIGGNAGDPGGIAYWAGLLAQAEAGGESVQAARAGLVGQFVHDLIDVNLAAFTSLTPAQLLAAEQRQDTINNKIAVSLAYSTASQGTGGAILDPQSVGDAAYNAATAVLQSVTFDPATVVTAINGINTAVAHQDLTLI